MTDLNDLRAVCPPPVSPTLVVPVWEEVERRIGFQLPSDYKDLVSAYGRGSFARFIHVFQADSSFPAIDIRNAPAEILETLRFVESQGFPVPGGLESLFPIAVSDNGNYVFWRMEPRGNPDLWEVAVNEPRGDRWDFFKGNLTSFLAATLSGEHVVSMFPGDLLAEEVVFEVY
ncbi:SMI1/KNR4 family protein [Streptomyces olivochromogenes]|uniref:SMI1/KNR4 family protein n=1 Tax=Streptomyces olivochromogenes TaxID=1963 RepID=UPI003695E47A